jgi:beta-phosphoglucomutase-like phosphatase (HAD superfamily)
VFEDAPVGIQAARAAGMYAVALTTTQPETAMAQAQPDQVVANLVGYDVDRLIDCLRSRSE